ncbi:MAG: LLM class flavin-dependent oxidoreductase, partial [Acetobacteraceae bacterium]
RFYQVKDSGIGVHPVRGQVPIWVAAQAEPAIRRAARIGDAWLIVPSTTLETTAAQMRTYRAALAEYGREAQCFPIERECYVGASHRTAFEECRGPLEYKYAAYASWGLQGSAEMPFEDFVRDRFIIGDSAFVKEEVARYREVVGVDHAIMRVHWPGLEQAKALASIRRLGEIFA